MHIKRYPRRWRRLIHISSVSVSVSLHPKLAMECSICRPIITMNMGMGGFYAVPTKAICSACCDGANNMMAFLNDHDKAAAASRGYRSLPLKEIWHAFEQLIREMQGKEKEAKEKLAFLDVLGALREGLHTDILVKAGDGQPIPAHRAVLASKCEIFKTMLLADDFKAAPTGDIISLPELTHSELQHLLEFLYSGELPPADQEPFSTALSLFRAADKYDIPFLRKSCERRLLADLRADNVLDVLDVAQRCSSVELNEQAMRLVVEEAEEVVFSPEFKAFALRNPELCVEIARALASNKTKMNNS